MMRSPKALADEQIRSRSHEIEQEIDPTPEEKANGWTKKTLALHIARVEMSEHSRVFPEKSPIKIEPVASFDPHHW